MTHPQVGQDIHRFIFETAATSATSGTPTESTGGERADRRQRGRPSDA